MIVTRQIAVGSMQNFTYVVYDDQTRKGIILDPSWDLDRVQETVSAEGLEPVCIVNTHHHFDHTLGNQALARRLRVPIMQHPSSGLPHDKDIDEGDTVRFGEEGLTVWHTPGHSQDSICLLNEEQRIIFTGDTLFVGSCGRTDLPGGDAGQIYLSLRRLAGLGDGFAVYPGHHYGPAPTSTIGNEKATNMVLQPRTQEEFLAMLGLS